MLISATDPVAVIALFKELGVAARLSTLVDGESLFNDATAIVVFNIILGIVVTGGAVSSALLLDGVLEFFVVFFGGLAVGIVFCAVIMWIIALERDDHLLQIALTSVLAYVAFIVAEHVFHLSGSWPSWGPGFLRPGVRKEYSMRKCGVRSGHSGSMPLLLPTVSFSSL